MRSWKRLIPTGRKERDADKRRTGEKNEREERERITRSTLIEGLGRILRSPLPRVGNGGPTRSVRKERLTLLAMQSSTCSSVSHRFALHILCSLVMASPLANWSAEASRWHRGGIAVARNAMSRKLRVAPVDIEREAIGSSRSVEQIQVQCIVGSSTSEETRERRAVEELLGSSCQKHCFTSDIVNRNMLPRLLRVPVAHSLHVLKQLSHRRPPLTPKIRSMKRNQSMKDGSQSGAHGECCALGFRLCKNYWQRSLRGDIAVRSVLFAMCCS